MTQNVVMGDRNKMAKPKKKTEAEKAEQPVKVAPKKEDKFDDGIVYDTTDDKLSTTFIRTGCMLFDLACSNGEGLPVGGAVVLFSEPGGGKTTITMDVLRRVIERHIAASIPYRAVYVDTESSKGLLNNMGLAKYCKDQTIMYKSGQTSYKELEKISLAILNKSPKYKDVKLLIIDSLNYVVCEKEITDSIEKGDFGNNASARTKFLKIRLAALKAAGVTVILICQVRANQNVANMFADPKKIAASDADLHFADVIMKLSPAESASNKGIEKVKLKTYIDEGTAEITSGYIISAKTKGKPCKNRYIQLPVVKGVCEPGYGIDNVFSIKQILDNTGYIRISGTGAKGIVKVSPDLIACTSDTIPEEVTLFQFNKWCRNNTYEIMDFMISRDIYRVTESSEYIHNTARQAVEEDY
jgi:RecA/RadA recombinase